MSNRAHFILVAFVCLVSFVVGAEAARVARPSFNRAHGFYSSAISVEITTATSNARIRYTTDGSQPTSSHGTDMPSGGTVSINRTTPLRAIGYLSGWTTSQPFTATYIFLSDVLTQPSSPAGYPALWRRLTAIGTDTEWWTADYEMDPQVVNHSSYKNMIKDAFKSIPTLSLVVNRNQMFGSQGLYLASKSGMEKPEIACSAELIYADGRPGFQIDCGLKPHTHNVHKRSFRLLFKTNYGGPQKLEYPFFEDAPVASDTALSSFGKIFLRGGMNQGWGALGTAETVYARDAWSMVTQLAVSGIGVHTTFVHLYINGLYWGLYQPLERPDARFMADYRGGNKGDWDCNHMGGLVNGSATRWTKIWSDLANRNLADAGNYDLMADYLDLPHFADYIIQWWYSGGGDWQEWWGKNNFYTTNRRVPAEPLRFFCWDMDSCWQIQNPDEGRAHDGAWVKPQFLTKDEGATGRFYHEARGLWYDVCYSSSKNKHIAGPFRALWSNKDFRVLFADRLYRHCKNGGALTDANSKARWDALCSYIEDAIVCETARWGDHKKDFEDSSLPVYMRNAHWYGARDGVRNMMTGNADDLLSICRSQQMKGYPLYPSLNPPTYSKHGGSVGAGFQLTIMRNNGSGTIFYRVDGQDPRYPGSGGVRGGTSSSASASKTITLNSTTTVKARVKTGATWSALANATFTVSGPTVPAAPSSLAASAQSTTQIKLTWADNSGNESGFKIERSATGSSGWSQIATVGAGVKTYTNGGLAASTKYYYRVRAYNSAGNSGYSNEANATTQDPPPEPRIALSTTSIAASCVEGQNASSKTFQVWNGGTGTLLYKVVESTSTFSISPTTGSSTGSADKKTHTLTFTTSGLAAGTHNKTISVQDNGSGASNGPLTINVTISVSQGVPAAPSNLAAAALSTSRIGLTWTDNSDNETKFELQRSPDGSSWAEIVEPGANATSYTDSGLSANTKYYYRINAGNAAGDSPRSNVASATTDPSTPPSIAASRTSISVSVVEGQNAPAETFEVWNSGSGTLQYAITDNTSRFAVTPTSGSSTGSGDKETHTLNFSTAGSAVGVYDRTITIADSDAADSPVTIAVQITVNPPAPEAPSGFTAQATSPSEVRLTWNDLPTETQYMLRRSLDGSDWYALDPVYPPADATSYVVTGLAPETKYYFKLRGINDAGYGPYCAPVSVTTPAAPPPSIAASKTSIAVTVVEGENAPAETFEVWNAGGGTVQYAITDNTSRFAVTPTSGASTGSGDRQTHTVNFTTAGSAIGVYDRTITITDPDAANSPVTIAVQITVNPPAPDAPSGFAAEAISSTEVRLSWADLPTETQYMLRTSVDGEYWYGFDPAYPAADATSYTVSGLKAETTYYFKLRGINDAGYGPYCEPVSVTTPSPVPPAIAVSVTNIVVSCELGQDAPARTFEVWNSGAGTLQYAITDNTSRFNVTPTGGSSTGSGNKQTHTVNFTTSGSAAGVYDRVITIADDGAGAANSPVTIAVQITVTQTVPPAPTGVSAAATGAGAIAVRWQDNASNETQYKIRWGLSDTEQPNEVWLAANTTQWQHTGLAADTVYYYKVRAQNGAGASAYTAPESARTPLAESAPFTAYNDLAWQTGQSAVNITMYTREQQGLLVDHDTGKAVPARLTLNSGGGGPYATQGVGADTGTDAASVFDGRVDCTGLLSYATDELVLSIEGLSPLMAYELVLFGNRDIVAYAGRTTVVTLEGADSFVNASSAGATIGTSMAADDTTTIANGSNRTNGFVARYRAIAPGADGAVQVRVPAWSGTGDAGRFYLNALMLKAVPGERRVIASGATWRYRKGTAEASSPIGAWRAAHFEDSGWSTGPARFGYSSDPNEGPFATELTDMKNAYACLFLRREFVLDDPLWVNELQILATCDDGFIAWINGQEVARVNVSGAPGTDKSFDDQYAPVDSTEPRLSTNVLSGASLPELGRTNVLAVQVFNYMKGSSDFVFEVELFAVQGRLSASEDPDQDTTPDAWETATFGDAATWTGEDDPDQDGLSNTEEFIAGTGANSATSYLAVNVAVVAGELVVSVPTIAAAGAGYEGMTRYYGLQRCDAPGGSAWTDVPGFERVEGLGQTVTYADDTTPTACFRARVWLEE